MPSWREERRETFGKWVVSNPKPEPRTGLNMEQIAVLRRYSAGQSRSQVATGLGIDPKRFDKIMYELRKRFHADSNATLIKLPEIRDLIKE